MKLEMIENQEAGFITIIASRDGTTTKFNKCAKCGETMIYNDYIFMCAPCWIASSDRFKRAVSEAKRNKKIGTPISFEALWEEL